MMTRFVLAALALGTTPAFAQQAPELPSAILSFDRYGNVDGIEVCDAAGCQSLWFRGLRVTPAPEIGGFKIATPDGTEGWTGRCWEDEEAQQSVCEWIDFEPSPGPSGYCGCGCPGGICA